MSWEEVRTLRKAGQFRAAIDRATALLAEGADRRVRTQLDWSWYGLIKSHVQRLRAKLQAAEQVSPKDAGAVMDALRSYARLPAIRPDNALTNILREASKVAAHLPQFPAFMRWVGIDDLAADDWQYQEQGDLVFRPPTLAGARGLAKWIKAHPDADPSDVELALHWLDRIQPIARGDDSLWVRWDRALMLRRLGHHRLAAETLSQVLKAKRGEFWVWAEAARLYANEQPGLAISCFCRALSCPAEPKFTVNVHREFAELLAEQQEFAPASREVALALDIRQCEGWSIDPSLQALIDSPWYDPATPDQKAAQAFYTEHSADALVLCFDHVDEHPATFLGTIIPYASKDAPPGRKARPLSRFAVRGEQEVPRILLGPGLRRLNYPVGTPLSVIVVRQDGSQRETIVQVTPRTDGEFWDCTLPGEGVIVREASAEGGLRIYAGRDSGEVNVSETWSGVAAGRLGEGVRFRWARNPAKDRHEVFAVEPGPLPPNDVSTVKGTLRRQPAGHAFVGDAFVPPPLVKQLPDDVDEVVALVVYAKHPKREGQYGWRAVTLDAA